MGSNTPLIYCFNTEEVWVQTLCPSRTPKGKKNRTKLDPGIWRLKKNKKSYVFLSNTSKPLPPFFITALLVMISIIANFLLLTVKTFILVFSYYIFIFQLNALQQFNVVCYFVTLILNHYVLCVSAFLFAGLVVLFLSMHIRLFSWERIPSTQHEYLSTVGSTCQILSLNGVCNGTWLTTL